jgi:RND superfamily putative drug exporter
MTVRFHAYGAWLYKWRQAVVAVWLVLLVVAGLGAARAPEVLKGGAAGIPDSSSARAQEILRSQFDNPYQYSFLVTVTSPKHVMEDEAYRAMLGELQAKAAAQPFVGKTVSFLDHPIATLHSSDGHRTFFILGLKAKDNLAAEQFVPPTRDALAPVIEKWQHDDPGLKVFVTGEIPIGYDGTRTLMEDTTTAEHRIIPLAMLFLLAAFGGLAAAGIPVLVGAVASVLTLALLFIFGHMWNLSAMAQAISRMVGLGVGIDYSLIIVSRFREALAKDMSVGDAVAETVSTAGQAIVYSGLTVMIGFLALFFPGLIDTTSLALAGSLTVAATVALSLTLLPAALGILGRRIDWPYRLTRFIERFSVSGWWYNWAHLVMKYPARFLVSGTLILLLCSAPLFTVIFGQFSSKFLPAGMLSGQGLLELEQMHQVGQLYPISIVVKNTDGKHVFAPQSMKALAGVVRELRQAPVAQEVHSIVENASRLIVLNNLVFNGDVAALRKRFPEAAALMISVDGTATVIQVVPRSDASYGEIKDFVRGLQKRDWSKVPGFEHSQVELNGAAAINNDFEHAILSNLGKVVGVVFVITFILLYVSFRSVVLPLKALLMNTLSVGASFGMLVLAFQWGWPTPHLVGLAEAPGNILVPVPIIVFCAVFGLSMDYEVFLLARIQEEYLKTGDNQQAVAAGLAATGGIITNAAAIMLLVFGSFVAANVILTKMLGFGLAVAVLLDALVIRVMLVPSFMALVGKWNWWPNIVEPPPAPKAQEAAEVPTGV